MGPGHALLVRHALHLLGCEHCAPALIHTDKKVVDGQAADKFVGAIEGITSTKKRVLQRWACFCARMIIQVCLDACMNLHSSIFPWPWTTF